MYFTTLLLFGSAYATKDTKDSVYGQTMHTDSFHEDSYLRCEFAKTNEERVEWLDQMLIDTQRTIFKYGMEAWIVQSTLLGVVRDNQTIPWTWDVDMQTYVQNIYPICNPQSPVYHDLREMGYRIYSCMDNFARVCKANTTAEPQKDIYNVITQPFLDIYGSRKLPNGLYEVTFSPCKWNFTTLHPLKQYPLRNTTVWGPNDYEYWLEMPYGKTWKTPQKYGGGHGDECGR